MSGFVRLETILIVIFLQLAVTASAQSSTKDMYCDAAGELGSVSHKLVFALDYKNRLVGAQRVSQVFWMISDLFPGCPLHVYGKQLVNNKYSREAAKSSGSAPTLSGGTVRISTAGVRMDVGISPTTPIVQVNGKPAPESMTVNGITYKPVGSIEKTFTWEDAAKVPSPTWLINHQATDKDLFEKQLGEAKTAITTAPRLPPGLIRQEIAIPKR